MSDVQVLQVPEGSIVWCNDIDFADDDGQKRATAMIAEACGHKQFVLLVSYTGGTVEVFGPDDDFVTRVREALAADAPTDRNDEVDQ